MKTFTLFLGILLGIASTAIAAETAPAQTSAVRTPARTGSLEDHMADTTAKLKKYIADREAGHPWPAATSTSFMEKAYKLLQSAALSEEGKHPSDAFLDKFVLLSDAFITADETEAGMSVFAGYYDKHKGELDAYGGRKTEAPSTVKQRMLSRARKFEGVSDADAANDEAPPATAKKDTAPPQPPRKPSAYYPKASGTAGTGTANAGQQ